jgi:hypothetical protein
VASLPDMRQAFAGAVRAPAVLPNYRRPRSRLERIVKHGGFLAACVLLGLIYGFLYTLFPPQLLIYLGLPIVALSIVVIWALPDTNRAPTKLLTRLFFTLLVVLFLWPNYLALQLPGLPWMTLRRLLAFPLLGVFLICYSTSAHFRSELASSLRSVRPLLLMVAAFMAVQFLTIFWSDVPAFSLNQVLNFWASSIALLFVTAWVLTRPKAMDRFTTILILLALFLCGLAALEYWNGQVLWAGHIPSFLQVQDPIATKYLEAQVRDAAYRAVTTFSVSLSFAEFLAIVTPFVLHRLLNSREVGPILLWGLADLALLGAIVLTQSRLGIVGWLLAHVLYICIWAFRRWRIQRTDIIAPAISIAYPIGALLFFVGMFTIPAIRNRTIGGGSTGFSDQARADQFALLWPRLFDNPFGYGGGRSGDILGYRLPGGMVTVDSYVITLAIDYGIIGLCLFFGALIYAAAKMFQIAWRSPTGESAIALPLACALTIVIQIRLVLSQPDNIPLFYMLIGMAAVVAWRARSAEPEKRSA